MALTQRLQQLHDAIPALILAVPDQVMDEKPSPDKWSKKEILGHLLDSAINNHTRFVKISLASQPLVIEPYAQDDWVRLHHYQQWPADELVRSWESHQAQIIWLMRHLSPETLDQLCDIGKGELKTLAWLYLDYVDHLEHHLHQLVDYDF